MAEKKNPISEYLAEIGAKGGKVKGAKGFSSASPEQRKAYAKKAAATRRANAKKKAAKAPK